MYRRRSADQLQPVNLSDNRRIAAFLVLFDFGKICAQASRDFKVAAETIAGLGPYCTPQSVQTTGSPPGAPVQGLNASALASTSIEIRWFPPASDEENGNIIGYNVIVQRFSSSSRAFMRRNTVFPDEVDFPDVPVDVFVPVDKTISNTSLSIYNVTSC